MNASFLSRLISFCAAAAAVTFTMVPPLSTATIINTTPISIDNIPTTTNYLGGTPVIGGYLDGDNLFVRRSYYPYDSSGSGTFRTLFRAQDTTAGQTNDPENGYNRATAEFPDISMPGGLVGSSIVYSNLKTDPSGQYFVFALDANENQAGSPNYFLSLDDLRFYRGGTNDPNPLPGRSNLADLGTLVWGMNTDGNNTNFIFVDASISSGSGTSDLFVYIKKSLFTGAAANDFIYMYASMGQYQFLVPGGTDLSTNDGFEEWAILDTGTIEFVPEPASIAALLVISGGLFWHRRRRRVARRS